MIVIFGRGNVSTRARIPAQWISILVPGALLQINPSSRIEKTSYGSEKSICQPVICMPDLWAFMSARIVFWSVGTMLVVTPTSCHSD